MSREANKSPRRAALSGAVAKQQLDQALVARRLVASRNQAESYIKLGEVQVNGATASKPGRLVGADDKVVVTAEKQYVSRAALKLASVTEVLKLDFADKTVLDVGSSTGGFTDFALRHGAKKVIAVEIGTNQLHPSLRGNLKIELHEKTDIRDVALEARGTSLESRKGKMYLRDVPDIVVIDVSFVSLREILPHISSLVTRDSLLVCMVKPQFEAEQSSLKHKGVIKNDKMRRDILKDFEAWARTKFIIQDKADSQISGSKGNVERFYLLKKL